MVRCGILSTSSRCANAATEGEWPFLLSNSKFADSTAWLVTLSESHNPICKPTTKCVQTSVIATEAGTYKLVSLLLFFTMQLLPKVGFSKNLKKLLYFDHILISLFSGPIIYYWIIFPCPGPGSSHFSKEDSKKFSRIYSIKYSLAITDLDF